MNCDEIDKVIVYAHWLGFADPSSHAAKLEIAAGDGNFRVVDPPSLKNHALSREAVSTLLAAIDREPIEFPDPKALGMPASLVEKSFASDWTDDSPVVRVKLLLKDGSRISIHSDAQHDFMIPWTVTQESAGKKFKTYDHSISLAVAGLLPDGFLNRERLLGASLAWVFHGYRRSDSGVVELLPSKTDSETGTSTQGTSIEGEKDNEPDLTDVDKGLLESANPPFNPNLFKIFLSQGANVNARRPHDGLTGLSVAAAGGMQEVAQAWIAAGADVNLPGNKGETALMMAASWPEIARKLLAAGANVKAVDSDGSTALMYAVIGRSWTREQRKIDVVNLLLSAGADATVRDKTGRTALTYALEAVERIRVETEVQNELLPLGVGNQSKMDFEFTKDSLGKDQVLHHPRMDGTELCRLLESAGTKP